MAAWMGAVAWMGCGSSGLLDGNYQGSLTKVGGQLHSSTALSSAPKGPIGVTVLWLPYWVLAGSSPTGGVTKGGGAGSGGAVGSSGCGPATPPSTTSDIAHNAIAASKAVMYGTTLPTSFLLPLNEPPPASAMVDLGQSNGRGQAAIGTVIAFEDVNGNGQYDLGSPGTAAEPILAASIDVSTHTDSRAVLFLNGILPRDLPWPEHAQQGFNIVIQGPTRIDLEPNSTPVNIDTAFGTSYAKAINTCGSEETRYEFGQASPPAGASIGCFTAFDKTGTLVSTTYDWDAELEPAPCTHVFASGSVCFNAGDTIPPTYPACSN